MAGDADARPGLRVAWFVGYRTHPQSGACVEFVGIAIWVVFILDFALRLILAPDKSDYLKANWLTALALAVPALRVFRIFRVVRVLRAARGLHGACGCFARSAP